MTELVAGCPGRAPRFGVGVLASLALAAAACEGDSGPSPAGAPPTRTQPPRATTPEPAVESAWIVARVLDEAPSGPLADPRTTYTMRAGKTFTARPVGVDALAMPEEGARFALDLRGRRFVNGYRSFAAGVTPLDVGVTYLIRLCEGPRFRSLTACTEPGAGTLRLIEDDPRMSHAYYIVEDSRAVIGWTAHGPALTRSLMPDAARRQARDCLVAAPPDLAARLSGQEQQGSADPDSIFADMPPGDGCDEPVDVPFHLHAPPAAEELYAAMTTMGDAVGPEIGASKGPLDP